MKNPMTPAGIEPATFRFVAQHLNHYATAVPILLFIRQQTWDPFSAHFRVMKVLFNDCFHTLITDVQYSKQLVDSYSPVLPKWIHRLGHCSRPLRQSSVGAHEVHSPTFPFLFSKHTAPLIDTNIWHCLLTTLPLQSWIDFRPFATFFRQEFDSTALLHANVYVRFAHLRHNDKTSP